MDYEVFLQWSLVGVQIIQLSGVLLITAKKNVNIG